MNRSEWQHWFWLQLQFFDEKTNRLKHWWYMRNYYGSTLSYIMFTMKNWNIRSRIRCTITGHDMMTKMDGTQLCRRH